ncbi:MAG: hypothetical protein HN919_16090 [Verrucomicrobia bacterium]|jgi:hypothetical protein|nr:hypothetical protein [Verrucomicrobiota bacterium]MBT7067820.1 hypothetical protein [Verrucomicrobiota bacterium]MBT7701964.1 hypothetical protein [Verrucomicrobiota bacterium]
MHPRLATVLLCMLVAALYGASRAGNLDRPLVYEGYSYLQPGLSLFNTGHYALDAGVLDPDANTFHKPPLTFLLLGASARCHADPVRGARLVPMLVGLWVVLVPLLATGSVVPSLVILMSPFFYAAAGHIQTDPIVGLLGCSLVTWGMLRLWERREVLRLDTAAQWLIAVGLSTLWLGKLETAVLASAGVGLLSLALPRGMRRQSIVRLLQVSLCGMLLFILVTFLLGLTNAKLFDESVGRVVRTLYTQTDAISRSNEAAGGTVVARHSIFKMFVRYRLPLLFALALLPALISLPRHRARVPLTLLLVGAAVVLAVPYMVLGIRGEGYPRYFLTAFIPLLLLQGKSLSVMSRKVRWSISAVILVVAAVGLLPRTCALMASPGSPTAWYGTVGTRQAVNRLQEVTREGDLVMGPGAALFYLHNRQKLTLESFIHSQARTSQAVALGSQVQAAVVFPRMGIHHSRTPVGCALASLLARDPVIEKVGSWRLIYAPRQRIATGSTLD